MKKIKLEKNEIDEPGMIIEELIKKRKVLMSGIGGAEDVNKIGFDESFKKFPSHWAISLSGEPTIYPKLGKMISLLRKEKEVRSIFLVTNGQEPRAIASLKRQNALPTQFYVSISAPNRSLFKKLNRSIYRNGWARLQKTLSMLRKLRCRTVIRFTLMQGINDLDDYVRECAEMFESAQPDFVEVKAYMYLGLSRKRLKQENMPSHDYVKQWTKKLARVLKSYKIESEDVQSRIVLLKRKKWRFDNFIKNA